MSEPNVLVNFRLDRDKPLRVRWFATDGVPGDGYKAQVTAIMLPGGTRLAMDASAILEHTGPDASGGIGAYQVTFNGMVGFAADHPDRKAIDKLGEAVEIEYELAFVSEENSDRAAIEGQDYKITDRPRAMAHNLSRATTA